MTYLPPIPPLVYSWRRVWSSERSHPAKNGTPPLRDVGAFGARSRRGSVPYSARSVVNEEASIGIVTKNNALVNGVNFLFLLLALSLVALVIHATIFCFFALKRLWCTFDV